MSRIRVRLVRVEGSAEVSMDMDDFESSDPSVARDVKALKDSYDEMVRAVKPVLASKPSTTERWRACRRIAEFADQHNKFDITNFAMACARDMKSGANIPLLMRFGLEFSEDEIHDSISYTRYRTLVSKKRELMRNGTYESERARLVHTRESASLHPNRFPSLDQIV